MIAHLIINFNRWRVIRYRMILLAWRLIFLDRSDSFRRLHFLLKYDVILFNLWTFLFLQWKKWIILSKINTVPKKYLAMFRRIFSLLFRCLNPLPGHLTSTWSDSTMINHLKITILCTNCSIFNSIEGLKWFWRTHKFTLASIGNIVTEFYDRTFKFDSFCWIFVMNWLWTVDRLSIDDVILNFSCFWWNYCSNFITFIVLSKLAVFETKYLFLLLILLIHLICLFLLLFSKSIVLFHHSLLFWFSSCFEYLSADH